MKRGTWIILDNGSGEIGRKFVPDTEPEKEVLLEVALHDAIVDEQWTIYPGDTIRFVEGESEVD